MLARTDLADAFAACQSPKIGATFRPATPVFALGTIPPAANGAPGAISAPDLCDRLTVTVIRNVVVAESPQWVKTPNIDRLA